MTSPQNEALLKAAAGRPFLTRAEAADLLRVHAKTMERWAFEGSGPRFRRHNGRVVYARDDLMAWSGRQARTSTSTPAML